MNKKVWTIFSIMLVATMILAACGPAATPTAEAPAAAPTEAAPAGEKVPVGIVLPTKDEPRWIQDETRFRDALSAAGYDVEILFSQGDSAKEKANVESLISKGIKVLIITPQDGTAAAAAANAARDAGVKVISYDRLIRDTDAVDYYVTFDSIAVGETQAQYLVDKATGSGNPLYIYAGAASDNNAFLFFEGAWNVLQPKIADGTFVIKNSSEAVALQDKATLTRDEMSKIIGQVTTNWDFNTAKNLAESNLTAAPAEDKGNVFILAPNDGTARAIADAFAADKDVTSYVVTGQDAEKASIQYIIDGKQSMTVLKDVRILVGDAIAAAIAYLSGGAPEETNTYNNGVKDVPAKPSVVIAVDKDNVQEAVIDSGYWPASDFTGLEAGAAEPTAAGEVKTISIWHQWTGDYFTAIEQAFKDYEAANPGIKIDLSKPDDVQAALQTAIPAGEGPDIIGWANDHIGDLSLLGIIVPLDDYGITQDFLTSTYEPAAVNGVVLNDLIYGLPESQEGIALLYNKALVSEEYLPTDPTDLDDLLAKAEKFQADKGMPLICNQGFGAQDAYHVAPIYFGSGVPEYVDSEGNAYMNTPEALAGAEWLQRMSKFGFAENSYDICNAAFQEGKVGAWWTGPWAVANVIDAGIDLGILPVGRPFVGIKNLMLSTNAESRGNAEAALDIMKYFTSAEVQKKLALVNKTIPAPTEALNDPEVAADPVIQGFGAALNLGVPMANHPYASAQWVPVGDASMAVWQGKQTPEEAMAAAQAAIETAVAGMK